MSLALLFLLHLQFNEFQLMSESCSRGTTSLPCVLSNSCHLSSLLCYLLLSKIQTPPSREGDANDLVDDSSQYKLCFQNTIPNTNANPSNGTITLL